MRISDWSSDVCSSDLFLACWLIIIGSSGYVGLATMLAALSLIVQAALAGGALRLGFVAITALLILYNHRDNMRRLRAGNASRFERARVFLRPLRSRRWATRAEWCITCSAGRAGGQGARNGRVGQSGGRWCTIR